MQRALVLDRGRRETFKLNATERFSERVRSSALTTRAAGAAAGAVRPQGCQAHPDNVALLQACGPCRCPATLRTVLMALFRIVVPASVHSAPALALPPSVPSALRASAACTQP